MNTKYWVVDVMVKKKSETMDTTSYYVKICVVVVLLWIHSVMLGMYVCIFGGT